ncbi:MAG: AAA family ATPase, partial [Bacteroidales bacterium]|nr:AAA family ATPase [Bacteroidales bacterium]
MAKTKTMYVCQNCGADSPKWIGRCPSCGEWNTYVEEVISKGNTEKTIGGGFTVVSQKPVLLTEVEAIEEKRINTFNNEFNRVLGGGLVPGSLVLIGGEPGIGKSTLVLQVVLNLRGKRTLYISGEESVKQIKLRAERLKFGQPDCYLLSETSLEQIFVHIQNVQPDLVVVDSIQTVSTEILDASPGSVSQVRECAAAFLKFCKTTSIPVILIVHINKE